MSHPATNDHLVPQKSCAEFVCCEQCVCMVLASIPQVLLVLWAFQVFSLTDAPVKNMLCLYHNKTRNVVKLLKTSGKKSC